MKTSAFILFLSIVLTVYGLVNTYIFIRGWQAIPAVTPWKIIYAVSFWLLVSAFVAARILERVHPGGITTFVTWVGSFWLAFMLYFFLAVVLLDLARLANHLFGLFPASFYIDYPRTKLLTLFLITGGVSLAVIGGYINARTVRIRKVEVEIPKAVPSLQTLNIVMASDIHMGTLIARNKTEKLVNRINSLDPDIVLFAGDIVDEDLAPVIKYNLGASLTRIRSKLGVYGITGNHEYIGGTEPAVRYLEEHGIRMLRDTAVLIGDAFWLVGREDRDRPRFSGKPRRELEDLMKTVDTKRPVILMDHQPFELQRAVRAGIDLQLSGHTHHGQVWPFNHITSAIYEISTGYGKFGETHFYVSSGYGTWGPPIRLGNRPEIVQIIVRFLPS